MNNELKINIVVNILEADGTPQEHPIEASSFETAHEELDRLENYIEKKRSEAENRIPEE